MKPFQTTIAALTISFLPAVAAAQCVDGVCRLPDRPTAAQGRWATQRPLISPDAWGRPLPAATHFRPTDTGRNFTSGPLEQGRPGGPRVECRDGVCRIQPERLSDCPACDCDGKYCTCGPDCPSHYESRNGLTDDLLARESGPGSRAVSGAHESDNRTQRPGDLRCVAPRPLEDPFRRPAPQVQWMQNYEHAIAESRRTGRPMLIKVSASWCQYCERMQRETYADPAVTRDIRGSYIPVALDGDRDRRLIEALGVKTLPATLIVTPDLRIVDRVEGFRTARQMTQMLGRFARRALRETGHQLAAR